MARSSTIPATFGNSSLTSAPLSPCCLNSNGDAIRSPPRRGNEMMRGLANGRGFPLSRLRTGFGSNVSMCDGPPNMNSMITRFAFGGKWGLRNCQRPVRGGVPLRARRSELGCRTRRPSDPEPHAAKLGGNQADYACLVSFYVQELARRQQKRGTFLAKLPSGCPPLIRTDPGSPANWPALPRQRGERRRFS